MVRSLNRAMVPGFTLDQSMLTEYTVRARKPRTVTDGRTCARSGGCKRLQNNQADQNRNQAMRSLCRAGRRGRSQNLAQVWLTPAKPAKPSQPSLTGAYRPAFGRAQYQATARRAIAR